MIEVVSGWYDNSQIPGGIWGVADYLSLAKDITSKAQRRKSARALLLSCSDRDKRQVLGCYNVNLPRRSTLLVWFFKLLIVSSSKSLAFHKCILEYQRIITEAWAALISACKKDYLTSSIRVFVPLGETLSITPLAGEAVDPFDEV